jgi:uncharacterized protein DUF4439
MTSGDGLATALAAEYAAIFGYGVVGAHLTKADQDAARQAETAHRNRRDALLVRLVQAKQEPPVAAPAYLLPFEVTDRASAVRLAIALEERTARVWRQTLSISTGDERKLSLDALTDCAVRATRWRRAGGVLPITVPFPGTGP